YLSFCDMYNINVRGKKTANERLSGLRQVIRECIKNGILREFFKKHQKEVEDMMMTVIPPEQALEFIKLEEYNKGVEEGEARGVEQGKLTASLNFARNMLKNNYSIESIMEITGLSRAEIEKL
ncbi:MAG: hypothetical protein ACTTKY_11655, partial [Catonella sp.]